MMELAKQQAPVRRVAILVTDHRMEPRAIDGYVVSLYSNGTLGFRGCRRSEDTEVRIPLAACLELALAAESGAAPIPSAQPHIETAHVHTVKRRSACTARKPKHRATARR